MELSGDTESRRKERNFTILVGMSSDGGELGVPWEGARQEILGLSLEGRTGIGQGRRLGNGHSSEGTTEAGVFSHLTHSSSDAG